MPEPAGMLEWRVANERTRSPARPIRCVTQRPNGHNVSFRHKASSLSNLGYPRHYLGNEATELVRKISSESEFSDALELDLEYVP